MTASLAVEISFVGEFGAAFISAGFARSNELKLPGERLGLGGSAGAFC